MKDDKFKNIQAKNIQAKILNMIKFDDMLNVFIEKKLRKQ